MPGVENTPEVASASQSPMVLAGQDGIAGGSAGGRGNIGVVKEDSISGNGIEGGRLADLIISIDAGVGPAPVVGDREDDVGTFGCGQSGVNDKLETRNTASHGATLGEIRGRKIRFCYPDRQGKDAPALAIRTLYLLTRAANHSLHNKPR